MNEWVGPDINVAGPLEMPPSDEFSISESTHLFGEFSKWTDTFEDGADTFDIYIYIYVYLRI